MKTGIKIMNLEGSNILKNNLEQLSIKRIYNGVFADSLLLERLKKIKLNISKSETTRDIITVQFSYGYTPKIVKEVQEKINELNQKNKDKRKNIKKLKDNKQEKEIERLQQEIKQNRNSINQMKKEIKGLSITKEDIRKKLYKEGFKLDFYKKDKTTKEYNVDATVNYVFWFRTPSKSRIGDAVFINKKLYFKIKSWQRMGLTLPKDKECKLVEMLAYESLTSSHIENTIKIDPNNILVINDIDSFFETNCAIVKTNIEGKCEAKKELFVVKNTLFDGQALLDNSLFSGSNGMMLLRQHFFKACGFRTHIQKFMKDWCKANKKDYNTYSVKDRYNNYIKVKDILMITTENAMKWEKFKNLGSTFDYWKQKVKEDDNIFGICKVDHISKFGEYQRMSYQMLNTLDVNLKEVEELSEYTTNYVNNLKRNDDLYIEYLKKNANEINPNNMIIDLCKHNKDFIKSQFYRDYKRKDISNYVKTLRNGKLLVEGDNLTITGNPYTMLLHAVGQVPTYIDKDNTICLDKNFTDPTLPISTNFISVYTKRFNNGEYLGAFRNPHNSPNNIGYHKNFRHELMEKYFNFSKNIMAVNMIRTEEQDLKNGEDEDSDFNFVTNNKIVVESAKKVFRKYPCIVNKINKKNKSYVNNIENIAEIDNKLAQAKNDIGVSSNLAQLAMSWYWKDKTSDLADIVCIMSVLAQVAIDNAKRQYDVKVSDEITRIRKLNCMKKMIKSKNGNEIKVKPRFWKYISKVVNEENLINCDCPMNLLQDVLDKAIESGGNQKNSTIDTVEFLKIMVGKANDKQMKKIEDIIKIYDDAVKEHYDLIKNDLVKENEEKWEEEREFLENTTISSIKKIKIKSKTMNMLIKRSISKNGLNKKFKRKLLNILHRTHKEIFLECFIKK